MESISPAGSIDIIWGVDPAGKVLTGGCVSTFSIFHTFDTLLSESSLMPNRRNPSGMGSFRQRHGKLWEGRIVLPDGRRVSVYGKSEREAKRKAKDLREDVERGLTAGAAAVTVKAYMEQWLEDIHEHERVREGTWRAYSGHVRNHIIPHLGRIRLRDLTSHHVNTMLSAVTKSGVSPATANRVRATLRTALADAVSARIVPDNAAKLSKPRKERRERVNPLTIGQIRQLFAATRDHDLGPLIRVAISTGLRQGELLALQWEDVDLERGELHVRHTLTRSSAGEWRLSDTKTDQSRRTIRLSTTAIEALRRQLELNVEKQILATQRWKRRLTNPGYAERGEEPIYTDPHDLDLVFPTSTGNPQHGSTVTHRVQQLIESVGLPRQRFHDLRHATATLLLSEGMDLFTVKEILGHSQISLTANTYGHLTEKLSDEAARRLGRLLDEESDG